MRIGISAYDIEARDLVDLAAAADELGFTTLWLGEHVVAPIGYRSVHPTHKPAPAAASSGEHHAPARPIVDPATRLVDPLVALAGCAARTHAISLATAVYLLPLRQPVLAARMVHTLHELSAGRFVLGVGAGWLQEEFAAVGVPFDGRGARLEEHLAVLRAALGGGPFSHDEPLHRGGGVQLCREPADVPVVLGGNTERALRRAARLGDGWICSGTPDLATAARLRERVLALRTGTGPFPVYVRVPRAEPELLSRYAAEGFDEVVVWADQVWPATRDLAGKRAALAEAALRLGVTPRPVAAPALMPGGHR